MRELTDAERADISDEKNLLAIIDDVIQSLNELQEAIDLLKAASR